MSFAWPVGKLDLINRALSVTGNEPVNVADDGSDAWNVCSAAYEDGLAVMMEESNWGWATKVAQFGLTTAPADKAWDSACIIPPDLIHIVWVRVGQNLQTVGMPTLYDILDDQLVLNRRGAPIVLVKYTSSQKADPTEGTPKFVQALTAFVMAGIYRGLHEDLAEANRVFATARALVQEAKTRYDQNKPKRQFWNSRLTASRRIRRPYPPNGNDFWGGTGSLG